MRAEILAEIRALDITGYTISDELPWDSSGTPLYLKNRRVVYVSEPNVEDTVLLNTLDGMGRLYGRLRTVQVYVSVDAKQKPAKYDLLVDGILGVVDQFRGFHDVAVELINTLDADQLVAEIEFRTTELRK